MIKTSRNIKLLAKKDVQCVEEPIDQSPLGDNEALIKTEMSLISAGTELSRVYGIKEGITYPLYTGYIAVGRIIAKGKSLTDFNIGDRVMYNGGHREFQRFTHGGKNLELIIKVDEALSLKESALVYLASIAMNGVYATDIKLGDNVAVFGLGTIGLITSKLYQLAGARVIALDPVISRTEDATRLGIKNVLSCPPIEQVNEIMNLTQNKGVDISVDVAGVTPAIINAVQSTAFNGQVILLGSARASYQGNITAVLNRIHMRMLTVRGAYNGLLPFYQSEGSRLSVQRGMNYLIQALKAKDLDANLLISHIISPLDAMSGYKGLMEERDKYKCVAFDWQQL